MERELTNIEFVRVPQAKEKKQLVILLIFFFVILSLCAEIYYQYNQGQVFGGSLLVGMLCLIVTIILTTQAYLSYTEGVEGMQKVLDIANRHPLPQNSYLAILALKRRPSLAEKDLLLDGLEIIKRPPDGKEFLPKDFEGYYAIAPARPTNLVMQWRLTELSNKLSMFSGQPLTEEEKELLYWLDMIRQAYDIPL